MSPVTDEFLQDEIRSLELSLVEAQRRMTTALVLVTRLDFLESTLSEDSHDFRQTLEQLRAALSV